MVRFLLRMAYHSSATLTHILANKYVLSECMSIFHFTAVSMHEKTQSNFVATMDRAETLKCRERTRNTLHKWNRYTLRTSPAGAPDFAKLLTSLTSALAHCIFISSYAAVRLATQCLHFNINCRVHKEARSCSPQLCPDEKSRT